MANKILDLLREDPVWLANFKKTNPKEFMSTSGQLIRAMLQTKEAQETSEPHRIIIEHVESTLEPKVTAGEWRAKVNRHLVTKVDELTASNGEKEKIIEGKDKQAANQEVRHQHTLSATASGYAILIQQLLQAPDDLRVLVPYVLYFARVSIKIIELARRLARGRLWERFWFKAQVMDLASLFINPGTGTVV